MPRRIVHALSVVFFLLGPNHVLSQNLINSQSRFCDQPQYNIDGDGVSNWILSSDDDVTALRTASNPWLYRENEEGLREPWNGTLGCLEITGDVSDLSSLSEMSVPITFIGSLIIHHTTTLHDLSGLESVTLVEKIGIGNNEALVNIKALESVTEINQLADVNPGELCTDLKLPFVLHPNVKTYDDGEVFSSEAALMRSVEFGPATINGVNQSCLDSSSISDAELEIKVRGLFDAIYPAQQYPQQISDFRRTFKTGQGTLRISASDNVPECELKEATLTDASSAIPGAVAEIDFLIGDNCIPSNREWVEDPLIVFDFGEDLPSGLRAGKLKNGEVQYLKRAKVVGPFLIYKLFDNATTPGGRIWKRGCHDGISYGPNGDINYLDACTEIDDLDEDPRHGYLRDPLLLVLPTTGADLRSIPTLSLFGLFALGGLVGIFGLRKLRK